MLHCLTLIISLSESKKPTLNSTTHSNKGKGKHNANSEKQMKKPNEDKQAKQGHDKHGKHDKHDKHDKHGKHKEKEHLKNKHDKGDKVSKGKEHLNGIRKQKPHSSKPTLSEQMTDDKKMADQFRNLLKHPSLLRILEQMEDEASGSASGSGEQGSGEKLSNEKQYIKVLEGIKARHKTGHRKNGLRKVGMGSKNSNVSKVHPIPLSKIDIDLIDALSSGSPSTLVLRFDLQLPNFYIHRTIYVSNFVFRRLRI